MSVPDFGTDVGCLFDTDPAFSTVSGLVNLGDALGRRLITPRETLDYDREYGTDIRRYLNADIDQATAAALHADVSSELGKDERVRAVDVDSSFDFKRRTLTLTVIVQTASGTFRFVLRFGETPTFELLSAEAA